MYEMPNRTGYWKACRIPQRGECDPDFYIRQRHADKICESSEEYPENEKRRESAEIDDLMTERSQTAGSAVHGFQKQQAMILILM